MDEKKMADIKGRELFIFWQPCKEINFKTINHVYLQCSRLLPHHRIPFNLPEKQKVIHIIRPYTWQLAQKEFVVQYEYQQAGFFYPAASESLRVAKLP